MFCMMIRQSQTTDGFSQIFELPNLDRPVYEAPGLSILSPVVSTESAFRRAVGKETLTELLFADLGDETTRLPYLIVSFPVYTSTIERTCTYSDSHLATLSRRRSHHLRTFPPPYSPGHIVLSIYHKPSFPQGTWAAYAQV